MKCPVICFGILICGQLIFAQTPGGNNPANPLPESVLKNAEKRREADKINGKNDQGMIDGRPDGRIPQMPRTKPDGRPYTKEERERIKALLSASPEDIEKFKNFLSKSKTGIFRLFPDLGCETPASTVGVIRVDKECADFIPGSWSYSFFGKNHGAFDYEGIRYKDGELIADSLLSQSMIVSLGDVALETVSLTSAGVTYLVDFRPATTSQEAKNQFAQIANGVEIGGFRYAKNAAVKENQTYVLRTGSYRLKESDLIRLNLNAITLAEQKFRPLTGDRKDLIIAFRIIRKESDSIITIVWKELSRQKSTEIIFPKNERITDIKTKNREKQ